MQALPKGDNFMLISSKGRYTLYVLVDLAKNGQNRYIPLKEIAERQKYFEEKRQKYPTRTIDRFYQDELVETLNKRFNQCLEKIANI